MTNTITIHRVTRPDVARLALVLLVAAFLRMHDFGRMGDFSYDQATLSILALDMASGKSLPMVGIPSSAGIPNSPMTVYVLAPLFALTDDPQIVTLMIAAFNVVGVGLLWLIAHRYFGARVALIAGLAYAFHPHAVHYSRSIWAQDTHTPILLFGALLALMGFLERKRWAQLAALPVFVIGAQIHYAAWTLLPAFAWIVWRGRKNIDWRMLAGSIILAALTLVPFAIGISQSAGAAAATTGEVIDQLDSLTLRNKALLYLARLMTGLGGPWVGMQLIGEYDVVLEFPTVIAALWLLVGAAVVLGTVVVWRRWGTFKGVLLALWAFLPCAVFIPNWTGVYPHYFIPNLPAFALLAAIGAAWLAERFPEASTARSAVVGAFALVLVTQGWQYFAFLRISDVVETELHPTPLHYLMDVREAVAPARDVIISGGTSGESGYDVWKGLLYQRADCVRELVIASGGMAIFPARPFAVITPPDALEAATGDLYVSESPEFVPLREDFYEVHHFNTPPQWNGPLMTAIEPVRFDNGVALAGYHLEGERVYLVWQLPEAGAHDYQYFAHFLDMSGEKIGQQDASFWPGRFWCAGDTLITWIDTDVPEAVDTLRVGLYRMENGQFINSSVLDEAGNPTGSWVDLPLRVSLAS